MKARFAASLLLLIPAALLLCPSARAQCVYPYLTTPDNNYDCDPKGCLDNDEYEYAEVDFESGDGNGWYDAESTHNVDWAPDGYTYDSVTAYQPLPTGETTTAYEWVGGYAEFMMTLTGADTTWEDAEVREADPGGGGPDTCYVAEIDFPDIEPFEAVTGGSWEIDYYNAYRDYDYIGYGSDLISYYRDNGRTPCGTSFSQLMQILTTSGWQTFVTNSITASIDASTATSTRAGVPLSGSN